MNTGHFVSMPVKLYVNVQLLHINYGHDLIQRFCQEFEDIYGKEFCTPNMHLQLHLKRCIMDFGTVYSFWGFSFERFNGVLDHTKQIIETSA